MVSADSLSELVRLIGLDVNAPLYFIVMHLWQGVAGLSDAALRLPSALFGAAAPLAVALIRIPGLRLDERLAWAALLALWTQGLWLSGEARGYTLLMLLATLGSIAWLRLIARPSLGRALAWSTLGALAILTHYHALLLVGLQGLAYLALRPRQALKTWPAALAFAPAFAWLAWHLPRIGEFMRPDVAWYPLLNPRRAANALVYPFGSRTLPWRMAGLIVIGAILAFAVRRIGLARGRRRSAPTVNEDALAVWVLAGLGVLGGLAIIGMGFVRPSFTVRYLAPFVPFLFLLIVLLASRAARAGGLVLAGLVALSAWNTVPWVQRELALGWRPYSWEIASADLMRGRPERLVFAWDHPASPILSKDQLDRVGGFFFARAGRPIPVTSVVLSPARDANQDMLAAAQGEHTAIIWAYDVGVRGTAARTFTPQLSALDPSLRCRNYARGSVGVLACDRQGSVESR